MELVIIGFLFGCFVGFQSYKMYMDYLVRKLLKALKGSSTKLNGVEIQVKEEPDLALFTEVNNNAIMLYKKDSNEFVAQAPTLEELANNAFTFNKINYAVVNHNEETLWFVEGKIKRDLDT